MDSGREQNYWPGFVDALSNVVLTLLFVIVVFIFALAIGTGKAVQEAAEQAKQAQPQTQATPAQTQPQPQDAAALALTSENQQLRQQIEQQKTAIAELTESNDALTQQVKKEVTVDVAPPDDKKADKDVPFKVLGNKIIISYPLSAASLDDKSKAALQETLEDFKKRLNPKAVDIRSYQGNEPFSAAQRFAYYRALSVRNLLIEKKIVDGASITSHILPPSSTEGGGRVEIAF